MRVICRVVEGGQGVQCIQVILEGSRYDVVATIHYSATIFDLSLKITLAFRLKQNVEFLLILFEIYSFPGQSLMMTLIFRAQLEYQVKCNVRFLLLGNQLFAQSFPCLALSENVFEPMSGIQVSSSFYFALQF